MTRAASMWCMHASEVGRGQDPGQAREKSTDAECRLRQAAKREPIGIGEATPFLCVVLAGLALAQRRELDMTLLVASYVVRI